MDPYTFTITYAETFTVTAEDLHMASVVAHAQAQRRLAPLTAEHPDQARITNHTCQVITVSVENPAPASSSPTPHQAHPSALTPSTHDQSTRFSSRSPFPTSRRSHADDQIRIPLEILVRKTSFGATTDSGEPNNTIKPILEALAKDQARQQLILHDILSAVNEGRRCLVLSDWRSYVLRLTELLRATSLPCSTVDWDLTPSMRAKLFQELTILPPDRPLILLGTGASLGHGFACPQLDTLFLTFPVAAPELLQQYLGLVLRPAAGKHLVRIYDYVDAHPLLLQRYQQRRQTYHALGAALIERSATLP